MQDYNESTNTFVNINISFRNDFQHKIEFPGRILWVDFREDEFQVAILKEPYFRILKKIRNHESLTIRFLNIQTKALLIEAETFG
jgi:hypothetical protein